jgi:hypothetical protein
MSTTTPSPAVDIARRVTQHKLFWPVVALAS